MQARLGPVAFRSTPGEKPGGEGAPPCIFPKLTAPPPPQAGKVRELASLLRHGAREGLDPRLNGRGALDLASSSPSNALSRKAQGREASFSFNLPPALRPALRGAGALRAGPPGQGPFASVFGQAGARKAGASLASWSGSTPPEEGIPPVCAAEPSFESWVSLPPLAPRADKRMQLEPFLDNRLPLPPRKPSLADKTVGRPALSPRPPNGGSQSATERSSAAAAGALRELGAAGSRSLAVRFNSMTRRTWTRSNAKHGGEGGRVRR